VTSAPAVLHVASEEKTTPFHVTLAARTIMGQAYKSDCAGSYETCNTVDQLTAACFDDFAGSVDVSCPGGGCTPRGVASQISSISGAMLKAIGTADGDDGCTCAMFFADSYSSSSSYTVWFTLDAPVAYTLKGTLGITCGDYDSATMVLTHAGGPLHSFGSNEGRPFAFSATGVLTAGDYMLEAIALSGGSAQMGVCFTPGPGAAFDVTLGVATLGDFNRDGVVNGADLGLLLAAWGDAEGFPEIDLNDDGAIDGSDLGILLASWTA
jgi:hypothetical protein